MSHIERVILLAAALLLAGCASGSLQAMAVQPRYDTYAGSGSLPNGASAQALAPGVVARGHLEDDTLLYTGLNADGTPGTMFPFKVTRAVLARGQTEYNAYCTPCHDFAGSGHGLAVRAGFPQPPSLTAEEERNAPVGTIFATITNGKGPMPSYAAQVTVPDRWAIVAYLRALQLSQHATLDDVPAEARSQIGPAQTAMP
jgi:hypothetical protein